MGVFFEGLMLKQELLRVMLGLSLGCILDTVVGW